MFISLETLADGGKWLTIAVLLLFSIMNIAVITERIIFFRNENNASAVKKAADALELMMKHSYDEVIMLCSRAGTGMMHLMSVTAIFLKGSTGSADEAEILELELENSIALEKIRAERHVTILGSTGSVSPLIGLFGTVLGIMKSFAGISSGSAHGSGVLQAVSAGIWEALYTTAFGIFVSVPALILYNYFINKSNNRLDMLANTANRMIILARKKGK